jgi:diguanylate cyclase (GGDEF)-like protein
MPSEHDDKLPPVSGGEKGAGDGEPPSTDEDRSAASRERSLAARENALFLREGTIAERERRIRAAEKLLAASDTHNVMLQQANMQLVIASIEAHELTEQAESTKAQLDHLAHHDVLTGLPNRMLLQDRLNQAIELASRQSRQLAVMFMDLDRFKHINDTLGHAVGDKLLCSVAKCLSGCVRQSDTVSRQGGDEFVLLFPVIEQAEDAATAAQKMLTALAQPHAIGLHNLRVNVSIGISIFPNDGQDAETLIKNADTAMYYAKQGRSGGFKFFEPGMNARALQRESIAANLLNALERREFIVHYQPKIELQSGRITGVEALVRWQHPERGLLDPAQFVPVAEDCGLILPIGRWVLREACRRAKTWLQRDMPQVAIAVNISALEFRARDFIENVSAALEEARLEPRHLQLELTESILMRDAESSESVLQALADLGVRLAIDDFGTGYSSLSYLRKSPIDTLKIDQSFVGKMTSSLDDATVVSAAISMGKSLKKRVVAEGVETAEQYASLLAQQCDEGQGHYFGGPMTAAAITEVLLMRRPALQGN